ncbi:MAG TPA: sensor histidine kinase [Gemmatimonadaceae bacterium]
MSTDPVAADGGRPLATALATELRESRSDLVGRWLDRISSRVTVDENRIFPTEELLNHVPLLIDGIAGYLEHPEELIDSKVPVAAKAMELGALRHSQGFDAYEILKEYEILGAILDSFLSEGIERHEALGTRREVSEVWQRVGQAIDLIRQATMTHFLRLSAERVNEREERLRRFNRMVSHELKNRVGAIRGAAALLIEPWLGSPERDRFQHMIIENSDALQRVLSNLESLSRIEADTRQRRNVLLPQACAEAARQLRPQSDAMGVDVRISPDLPPVEVDAGGVELCLVNFLSNAIKYSDPSKAERWVEITGEYRLGASGGELTVYVRDNGIGVPVAARPRLFEQFYRAHGETVTEIGGTGLGLSIVRETAESLGGRAWAQFPDSGGSVFAFSLPSRREEDAAAAGTRRPDGGSVA